MQVCVVVCSMYHIYTYTCVRMHVSLSLSVCIYIYIYIYISTYKDICMHFVYMYMDTRKSKPRMDPYAGMCGCM
jgi:hypothetical protein